MFERFSKQSRFLVERAQQLAADQQTSHVRPEHLFRALLDDGESLACHVLAGLDASPEKVLPELAERVGRRVEGLGDEDAEALATIGIDLEEVLRRLGDVPSERQPRGRPRFTKESKKVLELALREAIALQHGYIGNEHVLLGLVRGGDPVVRDTLAAVNVTSKDLRAAVADAVRKAG
jgi:ATP-dependent Clp protease ATP-binding subunit ClpA